MSIRRVRPSFFANPETIPGISGRSVKIHSIFWMKQAGFPNCHLMGVTPKENIFLEEIKAGRNGQEGTVLASQVSYVDHVEYQTRSNLRFTGNIEPIELLQSMEN